MPRRSKPYLRKQTKTWYCSIKGRQIPLGRDRKAAFERFHELMADQDQVHDGLQTLYDLSQAYLDWCEANRKLTTYTLHLRFLQSFVESIGKRLRPTQLRAHHVTKWQESLSLGSTSSNDAISIVQRMLNWAVEQEHLSKNPIHRLKKPRRKSRNIYYSPEQWKEIHKHADESLSKLLTFLSLTGCRPQEARTLAACHLHDDLIIFPVEESKGEKEARVIYPAPQAKNIVLKLARVRPLGPLFRNSRGNPWTKNVLVSRLSRISKKVGFRVIAYDARHTFATEALTEGGLDAISVAHLMGHRDTDLAPFTESRS